jgi:hypothetical protein
LDSGRGQLVEVSFGHLEGLYAKESKFVGIVRIGVFTTVSSVSVTNEKWPSKIDSGE